MQLISIRTNNVKSSNGCRGSAGDLDKLVNSIDAIGLMQPIVLNSQHTIIAGRRRLEAVKKLEWTHIPAVVCETYDDIRKALQAERDENTCRIDLTPTQKKELADRIRQEEKPKAEERKKETLKRGVGAEKHQKTSGKSRADNLSARETARADDIAAEAAETSRATLKKIDEVVESGEQDIINEMDETGKVDPAHKKVKERQKSKDKTTDPLAEAADAYCLSVRKMGRMLDEAHRVGEELSKDKLGGKMHWQSILHQIKTAKGSINAGMPAHKCPYCKATGKKDGDTCGGCKGCGYLDRGAYKRGCAAEGVPDESGESE